jgi:mRNA interferase RelE/StbE
MVMTKIVFTVAATRQWAGLSADIRKRIDAKLTRYSTTGAGDVTQLKGSDARRLRVGDWRVVFFVKRDTIIIAAVGHRREIYD